jgi:ubiquinone biosynthesis protein
MEVSRLAHDCGIFLPSGLAMLGKTLLNLDRVARVLDPKFDPNASIQRHARDLMQRKMAGKVSTGTLFHSVLETTDFVQKLPDRMNKIFDMVANNQVKMTIDAIDEGLLISGIQKIANRVTSGIIFAAMIIGAALIMRIPSSYQNPGLSRAGDHLLHHRGHGRPLPDLPGHVQGPQGTTHHRKGNPITAA